jgi:starch phosphorylase
MKYTPRNFGLLTQDVDGFDSLAEFALDMRSSWNHAADNVWRQVQTNSHFLTSTDKGVVSCSTKPRLYMVTNC